MDLIMARAIVHDLNEAQLRDILLHIILRVRIGTPPTWDELQDLLDKSMAARRVA